VVPNVVDETVFLLPPRARERRLTRFLAVSRLVSIKGVDRVLRAVCIAQRDVPSLSVEIVGDGPERPRLEALARELGISDRVRFAGALDHAQVRDAMWRADALVHGSRVETFGVVVIEAMATGLPVIAYGGGALDELVDARSGILLPQGDEAALAAALRRMARGEHEFDARLIRDRAIARFGGRAVAEQLVRRYDDVLGIENAACIEALR
jgi:glycosyltransferase involved in cell wall biosynthesis